MGIGGIWQWVVVLAIILLLFGTKKLRNLGSDLGHAVKGFRKGMSTEDKVKDATAQVRVDEDPAATANTAATAAEEPASEEKPAYSESKKS